MQKSNIGLEKQALLFKDSSNNQSLQSLSLAEWQLYIYASELLRSARGTNVLSVSII